MGLPFERYAVVFNEFRQSFAASTLSRSACLVSFMNLFFSESESAKRSILTG
jgi:hypothetical protein